jgi:NADH dehydrogenase (ubiquinone) 1 alpha subcomplex subunit 9
LQKIFTRHGSEWLRTKWLGEQAVFEEFPDATIFRPTEMYGFGDSYLK